MSAIDPQFAADFTERFAPYLNPLPEVNGFREYLNFCPSSDRSGLQYSYPVQAAISHGVTFDKTGTAYTLNAARSAVELKAFLDGQDISIREQFPYSAAMKARNGVSLDGDAAAYWDPMEKALMTSMRGMEHYVEMSLMYGAGPGTTGLADIGVIATAPGPVMTGTGPNWNSATHPVVLLTQLSWAPGIWNNSGSGGSATGGMLVDVYDAALTALQVADVQIEGVFDASKCAVQMFKAGAATAVTGGWRLVPKGSLGTSCVGVQGILANTGLFANISATTNPFWRARNVDLANNPLTITKFSSLSAKLKSNGGTGDLTAFMNPVGFAELVNGTIGNTRWNNSMGTNSTKMQGADVMQFMSATGVVTFKSHEYMKQGECWVLRDNEAIRVGATDITFRGANGDEGFFLELTNQAGSEVRGQSQQAPLLIAPYHNLRITGILSTDADVPSLT